MDSLKLTLGLEVNVHGIDIKPLTLKEIGEIGQHRYEEAKGILSLEVSDFEELIENLSEDDIKELSPIDILCLYSLNNEDFKNAVLDAFRILINPDIDFVYESFVVKNNEMTILGREIYEDIREVVFAQNKIARKEKDNIKFGNKLAREFQKELDRRRARIEAHKRKDQPNIEDYILALMADGISSETLYNLTIYQLYAIIEQKQHMRESNFINSAVYAGTIEMKGVDKKMLEWVKKIK